MDDTKAKENLLRWMSGVTGDRDPPDKLGTKLKMEEWYTNFPLLDSSTLATANSGMSKDGLDGLYFLFRGPDD
jgi:hypothetical protein